MQAGDATRPADTARIVATRIAGERSSAGFAPSCGGKSGDLPPQLRFDSGWETDANVIRFEA